MIWPPAVQKMRPKKKIHQFWTKAQNIRKSHEGSSEDPFSWARRFEAASKTICDIGDVVNVVDVVDGRADKIIDFSNKASLLNGKESGLRRKFAQWRRKTTTFYGFSRVDTNEEEKSFRVFVGLNSKDDSGIIRLGCCHETRPQGLDMIEIMRRRNKHRCDDGKQVQR